MPFGIRSICRRNEDIRGMKVDKSCDQYYNITNGSHDWRLTQGTAGECEHRMPAAWAIRFCGTGLSIFAFRGIVMKKIKSMSEGSFS